MRAAGVPARIVGGYAGGTVNPYGSYLIVYQSDAHAWVEVFIEGEGWIRVDPTFAVAPERISRGISDAVSEEELPGFLKIRKGKWISDYLRKVEFGWDAVSIQWDIWFIGYSFWEQRELLSRLGIIAGSSAWVLKALLLIVCLVVFFVACFVMFRIHKFSSRTDAVQKIYNAFCDKMAQKGMPRQPAQGPYDYAKMVGKMRKPIQKNVTEIIDLYVNLRYGIGGNADEMKKLKTLVRKLN